jgi:uncharacterized protein DUF3667
VSPPSPAVQVSPGPGACPNCGSSVVHRYCAECGQAAPTPTDYSFRAHAADFFEQLTSLDGKAARTLWTLLSRPGLLTADHLAGRRSRYLRPLQLFLVVNVLLFFAGPRVPLFSYSLAKYSQSAPPSPALVRSLVARAAPAGDAAAVAEYTRAFDGRVEAERKSLILLFAPALALVLTIIFRRRGVTGGSDVRVPKRYGEHLVFALHLLAFIWLVLVGWGAVVGALAGKALARPESIVVLTGFTLLMLTIPAYLFRASQRVYALSRSQALGLTSVLSAVFVGLLVAYRALLFFTTYYTL